MNYDDSGQVSRRVMSLRFEKILSAAVWYRVGPTHTDQTHRSMIEITLSAEDLFLGNSSICFMKSDINKTLSYV